MESNVFFPLVMCLKMEPQDWTNLVLDCDRSKSMESGFNGSKLQLLIGAIDPAYDAQDEVKKAKKRSLLGGLFK